MILPDANLSWREHQVVFHWWKELLEKSKPVELCHPVFFAFIHLSTSPRVMQKPLTVEETFTLVGMTEIPPPFPRVL